MQFEIREPSKFVKEESAAIDQVGGRVDDAAQALDQLVSHVGIVADMVDRIAVAAEQRATTSTAVSGSMETIDGITRELAGSVGEIKNASEGLLGLATGLDTLVGWFKV